MNFKNLALQAKKAVDKRGGTDALKEDLGQLQKIAKGKGTPAEKAKAAAAALKEPGRTAPTAGGAAAGAPPAASAPVPAPDPTAPPAGSPAKDPDSPPSAA